VNGCQQEVRPVGLGYECIHRLQCLIGQLYFLGEHDDGDLWFNFLDLGRYDTTIQKTQAVVNHNGIHRSRHEKPQTIATAGRGYQLVSVLLQQN
jgi:hypothetical protein